MITGFQLNKRGSSTLNDDLQNKRQKTEYSASPARRNTTSYNATTVSIEKYPTLDREHQFNKGAQITLGDLHGNALKLLFFLIRHGVVEDVTAQDYQRFIQIYKKRTNDLTQEDLTWFEDFLNTLTYNQDGVIRLIGDDLADRGSNDYFTLKIFEQLHENQVPVEVMISNHSIEFIEAHEKKAELDSLRLLDGQADSMSKLQILIKKGLVARQDVNKILNKSYLPNVKLLSYSFDEATQYFSVFSHAPIGLETIEAMAAQLDMSFNVSSIKDFAQTIEKINSVFTEQFVKTGQVHKLFAGLDAENDLAFVNPKEYPFVHLIWNRDCKRLKRPEELNGFKLKFIHGHDSGEENILRQRYNLDNTLGKYDDMNTGLYNFHYTQEKQLTQRVFHHAKPSKPVKNKPDLKSFEELRARTYAFQQGARASKNWLPWLQSYLSPTCYTFSSAWHAGNSGERVRATRITREGL